MLVQALFLNSNQKKELTSIDFIQEGGILIIHIPDTHRYTMFVPGKHTKHWHESNAKGIPYLEKMIKIETKISWTIRVL
jgi:hypothetical protein